MAPQGSLAIHDWRTVVLYSHVANGREDGIMHDDDQLQRKGGESCLATNCHGYRSDNASVGCGPASIFFLYTTSFSIDQPIMLACSVIFVNI